MTKKAHTATLIALADELPALIEGMEADMDAVASRMAELRNAGLIYASEFWRKDRGEPKYFYLIYPQVQGKQRERIYIGRDQQKIAEARAGIARAKEYDELESRLSRMSGRASQVASALQEAGRFLRAKA